MMSERQCPHCHHKMESVEDSEWHLGKIASFDVRCPNCGFRDTIVAIVAERDKTEYRRRK